MTSLLSSISSKLFTSKVVYPQKQEVMKITFKKLTAQQMMDEGVHTYFYVSPKFICGILFIALAFFIGEISLQHSSVFTQIPYAPAQ